MSAFYSKQPGQLATIQTIVYALGLQFWMQRGSPNHVIQVLNIDKVMLTSSMAEFPWDVIMCVQ